MREQLPQVVSLSVQGKWDEGLKTTLQVRQFQPFHTDEPRELGGSDTAPNPMEYVLAALCGCEVVMINMIAKEMGFRLQDIQLQAQGDIDTRGLLGTPGVRRHFQTVRQTIRLRTPEPAERVNQLREAVEARCPAFNLLKDAGAPPHIRWETYH